MELKQNPFADYQGFQCIPISNKIVSQNTILDSLNPARLSFLCKDKVYELAGHNNNFLDLGI